MFPAIFSARAGMTVVVGDNPADGLGVAQMTVSAENACRCALVA
jgi:hypothetical protein